MPQPPRISSSQCWYTIPHGVEVVDDDPNASRHRGVDHEGCDKSPNQRTCKGCHRRRRWPAEPTSRSDPTLGAVVAPVCCQVADRSLMAPPNDLPTGLLQLSLHAQGRPHHPIGPSSRSPSCLMFADAGSGRRRRRRRLPQMFGGGRKLAGFSHHVHASHRRRSTATTLGLNSDSEV